VRFQGCAQDIKSLVIAALLMSDHAEEMQCAEMTFARFKHLQAETFGFCREAALIKRDRLIEQLLHRGSGLRGQQTSHGREPTTRDPRNHAASSPLERALRHAPKTSSRTRRNRIWL
jgi:hypothetical protein